MVDWLKSAWRDLVTEMFDRDGLDTVFSHARNVLTGAAIVAAGMYAASHFGNEARRGMWQVHYAGYVVSMLGALLLALNLYDGLRKLARRKHHVLMRVAAILVYVALSMRLAQVIVYFRTAV
ncbi:MAG TPA: hypothetical protein VF169_22840 [Albitalea sp.]|uniref:hypothetical protein n=1 Tax=Piscinibacter sp. TaxID=1903157 RepID=UPI002ED674C2